MTHYASLAAEFLRRARGGKTNRGAETPDSPERDPARLAPAARLALAQRRKRLLFRKVAAGTVALAAAVVVLAAGRWEHHGSAPAPLASHAPAHAFAILNAPASPSAGGAVLGTGMTLQAPPGAAVRIGSADGTLLTLEARGELSVVEQSATRRFALHRGAVRAQVAHLHDGERFLISTDDAEIEVHGTVFRVSLAESDPNCENGSRTRVAVTEGIVSVRSDGRETLVTAGDSWPACARSTSPAAVPLHTSNEASGEGRRRLRPSSAPSRETEGLAMANDLFAAAARAEREHRTADALRLFTRLLELAPQGPLAEGAAVQQMRLLAASDPDAGRRAAADYLVHHPDGFARDEARRLAGSEP